MEYLYKCKCYICRMKSPAGYQMVSSRTLNRHSNITAEKKKKNEQTFPQRILQPSQQQRE